MMEPVRGFRPCSLNQGKTQSCGLEYGVSRCQSRMMSASSVPLLWCEDYCLIVTSGLAADPFHRIGILSARDQPVSLRVLVDACHYRTHFGTGWIGKFEFRMERFQPLLDVQRLDTNCDVSTPSCYQEVIHDVAVQVCGRGSTLR